MEKIGINRRIDYFRIPPVKFFDPVARIFGIGDYHVRFAGSGSVPFLNQFRDPPSKRIKPAWKKFFKVSFGIPSVTEKSVAIKNMASVFVAHRFAKTNGIRYDNIVIFAEIH